MVATVLLAVSGHGFGHAVRSAEVARALLQRGIRVVVRTEAPAWLFASGCEFLDGHGCPIDVGIVQHDGLEFDVNATRARWAAFAANFEERADHEAERFERAGADVVLGDVPPLAFAAASRAGLPSLALGNFGWDWIYAAWPAFAQVVDTVRAAYARAEGLLRLPLHSQAADAFPAFARIVDVPLIARRAARPRAEVRSELGISEHEVVVLLSFGGFDLSALDLPALGALRSYRFVVSPPLSSHTTALPDNVLLLGRRPDDYVSLLAASDAVVTKPGYGIVADCLANRVPLLYTDRGPFREYDVLVAALDQRAQAHYIARDDLLAGRLGPSLEQLFAKRGRWTDDPIDGAEVVAERLLGMVGAPDSVR
jgi:UDP:flavonoid glycosyltransferase YjiC (YdhE family)